MAGNYSSDNDSVEVQRRREGASSGPEGRVEAPHRRGSEGSGGSGGGPSQGGGGGRSGSGFNLSGMPTWLIILIIVGYILYSLFSGGGGSQDASTGEPSYQEQPTTVVNVEPTVPPAAFTPPAASSGSDTWLIMLYLDADDKVLQSDITFDLNEVEKVGSNDKVKIVAQIDRYKGATGGDSFTSTRRYYVTRDNDLNAIHSQLVSDLGELNMSSGDTLVDFISWAAKTFPAEHHVLVLSDHGMGWPGGWSDGHQTGTSTINAPLASAVGDLMFLKEIDQALTKARQQTGIQKFDLIGMDACLMAQLEVMDTLQPHAQVAVLSEETEPSLGWAYYSFLSALEQNPQMSAAELGKKIVQSYIKDDQRIVDDGARAEFFRQGSPLGGSYSSPSAAQVTSEMSQEITLSAVDLTTVPALMTQLNSLVYTLQQEQQSVVANARANAQAYTNIFGKEEKGPYIDLGSFLSLLRSKTSNSQVNQAAGNVLTAIKQTVLAEKHGSGKPGSSGVAIYFPNSTYFSNSVSGPQSYTVIADRFAADSLWDDFMTYHYTGRKFQAKAAEAVIPSKELSIVAPGKGKITVSPITLSSKTAAPSQPVTLSVDITGTNIGYVYLFVGYKDEQSNSIFVADTDYLQSPDTRKEGDLYYPVWSDKKFTMTLKWNPTVFVISDGVTETTALLKPEMYGASAKDAVYTVSGMYTFKADGEKRFARLYFRDGMLRQVFGYNSQNDTGSPHEITPQAGDTFTVYDTWLEPGAQGNKIVNELGDTLTFGSNMFTWKEKYAAVGNYLVGFQIEDLDGGTTEVYEQISVK